MMLNRHFLGFRKCLNYMNATLGKMCENHTKCVKHERSTLITLILIRFSAQIVFELHFMPES